MWTRRTKSAIGCASAALAPSVSPPRKVLRRWVGAEEENILFPPPPPLPLFPPSSTCSNRSRTFLGNKLETTEKEGKERKKMRKQIALEKEDC